MIGSKNTDRVMDGAGVETQSTGVSCSICLESVFDNGDRSTAKLQCGHEFHLDCIGSAFNMKGEMQCPNCRKVEKGRWLYSNGSTRIPEYSMDEWHPEWNPDEEPYDVAFPELPFRVHWCPFGGMTRVRSSFEEVEAPSATYHDLQGHHTIFTEHAAGTSVAHSYVAYVGHTSPPSLNYSGSVEFDDPGFNRNWNGLSGQNDITSLHDFPPLVLHHSRTRRTPPTSSHVNGADQVSNPPATLRAIHGEFDSMTRSGTFARPFLLGHGSGPRAGSSFVPSVVPHHPGRSHERIQPPHVIHYPQQPSTSLGISSLIAPGGRRYNDPRGLPPVVPAGSHSDHSGGFFVFPPTSSSGRNLHEAENHLPIHTHPLERDYISNFPDSTFDRDSGWGSSHHQATSGSDSSNRTGNVWQQEWS